MPQEEGDNTGRYWIALDTNRAGGAGRQGERAQILRSSAKQIISRFARLPSGPCVDAAQTEKEAPGRRLVFLALSRTAMSGKSWMCADKIVLSCG